MSYVRTIPVRDSNGTDLQVFEYSDRRLFGRVACWKLCTGEQVARLSADTFVVVRTGEELLDLH